MICRASADCAADSFCNLSHGMGAPGVLGERRGLCDLLEPQGRCANDEGCPDDQVCWVPHLPPWCAPGDARCAALPLGRCTDFLRTCAPPERCRADEACISARCAPQDKAWAAEGLASDPARAIHVSRHAFRPTGRPAHPDAIIVEPEGCDGGDAAELVVAIMTLGAAAGRSLTRQGADG